jgi:HlyD family secretion protein
MNKKRIIWLSIGLLIAIIFIVRACNKSNQATEVSTYKVMKRTITEVVSVTGKIQPEFELKISPDVSGEITEMLVKEGDSVTKGQLLLRINPELYQTTMSQLKANLDNAKASLAGSEAQQIKAKMALTQAEVNFKRQQKLHDQKVISDQDWENARLQFENAQADFTIAAKTILSAQYNVKSLMARVDEGSKNLGRTSIYAPVSGIVTQLNSEKGERVVGTAQMAGTEIMRISNLNSMEVQVNINENDIVRVHRGDSANIKVDAYEDRVFKGIVTEIANSAKFNVATNMNEQVTNYTVKVRLVASSYHDLISKRQPQPFFPGMTASVDIKSSLKENVLSIPISSLTTRNPIVQKDETTTVTKKETEIVTWVFLYNNGISKAVKIKTGVQDIDYFEVLEGLKEGDEVISEPSMAIAKTLNDGDKVKKKK